jgi:hypothetical protein
MGDGGREEGDSRAGPFLAAVLAIGLTHRARFLPAAHLDKRPERGGFTPSTHDRRTAVIGAEPSLLRPLRNAENCPIAEPC